MRADGKSIDVTVVNLFPKTTKENEKSVSDIINKAINQGNSEGVTGYTSKYYIILFKVYLKTYLSFSKLFHWM